MNASLWIGVVGAILLGLGGGAIIYGVHVRDVDSVYYGLILLVFGLICLFVAVVGVILLQGIP